MIRQTIKDYYSLGVVFSGRDEDILKVNSNDFDTFYGSKSTEIIDTMSRIIGSPPTIKSTSNTIYDQWKFLDSEVNVLGTYVLNKINKREYKFVMAFLAGYLDHRGRINDTIGCYIDSNSERKLKLINMILERLGIDSLPIFKSKDGTTRITLSRKNLHLIALNVSRTPDLNFYRFMMNRDLHLKIIKLTGEYETHLIKMAKGRNKHPMRLDIFNVPALPVIFSAEGTDEDQPLSPLQSEVLDSVRQQALAVLENDLKPQAVTGDRSETLNEMKERAIQEITELAMRKIVPDQTKQVNSKQPDINGSDCQVQEAAVELDPVVPPDTSWETFKKLYDEYRRPGGSFQLKTGYYPNATLLKNEFIDICVGIGWKTDPMKDLWDEHYANTKHLVVTGDDDPNKVWKMKELEPYYNELMSKIDARLKLLNLHTSPGPRQEMYRIVKEILWEMKQ